MQAVLNARGPRRAVSFGAVAALALLLATTCWLMHRANGVASAQDAPPPVPGEQRYIPLEFAAAVIDGPSEGFSLEGILFLRAVGGTRKLEGGLLLADDTLVPATGYFSDPVGGRYQEVWLAFDLGDGAVFDLYGSVTMTVSLDPKQAPPRVPRVHVEGAGYFNGPTDDDYGVWCFMGEGPAPRAAAGRSDPLNLNSKEINWGSGDFRTTDLDAVLARLLDD